MAARRTKTVLIFAHECAPYHRQESTVAAQRPYQFARHLPQSGWNAVVVCADVRERRTLRREQLGSVGERARLALDDSASAGSVVIPTPSLRWDGVLDRSWWTLHANGSGGPARRTARKALTFAKFWTGDYSQTWQPCARAAARAIAERVKVDVCVGEHGPDAGLFLARWFSKTYRVPWVADFRDPILQPLTPLARRLYRPIARALVRSASGTINVNRVWVRLDRELFGLPSWCVPNGFDPDEFPETEAAGQRNDRFTVAYMGRLDALHRLEVFLDGVARAVDALGREVSDSFTFLYRGFAADRVRRLAAERGISNLVDADHHVDRDVALGRLRSADALLLLSISTDDEFYGEGFYPAKAFEYFGAKRPIVCVPGDGGLLDELVRDTRTGVTCGDAASVAEWVVGSVRAWRRGAMLPYAPNDGEIMRYSRQAGAASIAEILDQVVGDTK